MTQVDKSPSGAFANHFRFSTFICGKNNIIAYKASLAVAQTPGKSFNPLLIYGSEGKTHLLKAIRNYILATDKTRKVLYSTAEELMSEMLGNLRLNKIGRFRSILRNIDVLLLDDIQLLAGKERTQEELFHAFDALFGLNKQIVIASDRLPIRYLNSRLKSRFLSGVTAEITFPDYDMKTAFIRHQASRLSIVVPEAVVKLLASDKEKSLREVEGSLVTLSAYSAFLDAPITLELAQQALRKSSF